MRIDKITYRAGRDFRATLVCEHCDNKQELTTGYDDANYHDNVLPAITCTKCGKNRDGGPFQYDKGTDAALELLADQTVVLDTPVAAVKLALALLDQAGTSLRRQNAVADALGVCFGELGWKQLRP